MQCFTRPSRHSTCYGGVYEAHKDVLGSLPSADRKSTIGDVCAAGLESPDPFAKVDAAAGVLKGLLMADGENDLRTLVVVDDYNYLYHRTSYHETCTDSIGGVLSRGSSCSRRRS